MINSVILGAEGKFNIFDIPVEYRKLNNYDPVPKREITEISAINCGINIVLGKYINTLVHEMGHALALKHFGEKPKVVIFTDGSGGLTRAKPPCNKWKYTVTLLAGPIAEVAFIYLKLIALAYQKKRVPRIFYFICFWTATDGIINALMYAIESTIRRNNGDFGRIAQNGNIHLAAASAALIGTVALGQYLSWCALRK